MTTELSVKQTGRRAMLRNCATLAGGAFLAQLFPGGASRWCCGGVCAAGGGFRRLIRWRPVRAQVGGMPIQTQKLGEGLTLLSGPGGNVVVLNGADGKVMVDTFLSPAWPGLRRRWMGWGALR